jgi:nucleoside phosphorylase
MNIKLVDKEQGKLDNYIESIDHYRRAKCEFELMEMIAKDQILKLFKINKINVAYTTNNRRVCLDKNIVKIEKIPREVK